MDFILSWFMNYFQKMNFGELLWILSLWMKTLWEKLVLVVKLFTLWEGRSIRFFILVHCGGNETCILANLPNILKVIGDFVEGALARGHFSFIYLVTTYSSDEKGSIYFTFAEYNFINEGATLCRKCGAGVKEGDLKKEKGKTIF